MNKDLNRGCAFMKNKEQKNHKKKTVTDSQSYMKKISNLEKMYTSIMTPYSQSLATISQQETSYPTYFMRTYTAYHAYENGIG
jgi:maleate cis-trans isomerase